MFYKLDALSVVPAVFAFLFVKISRLLAIGDLGGNRTRDNLIKSQVLYRLSYQITNRAISQYAHKFRLADVVILQITRRGQ